MKTKGLLSGTALKNGINHVGRELSLGRESCRLCDETGTKEVRKAQLLLSQVVKEQQLRAMTLMALFS